MEPDALLRYDPGHAGGWSRRTFIKAARAEGVPIAEERYARIGDHGRMLHESAVFTSLDLAALGGCLGPQREGLVERPRLPVSESLAGRLLTLPPFTKVRRSFVQECARALRKVADQAALLGNRNDAAA